MTRQFVVPFSGVRSETETLVSTELDNRHATMPRQRQPPWLPSIASFLFILLSYFSLPGEALNEIGARQTGVGPKSPWDTHSDVACADIGSHNDPCAFVLANCASLEAAMPFLKFYYCTLEPLPWFAMFLLVRFSTRALFCVLRGKPNFDSGNPCSSLAWSLCLPFLQRRRLNSLFPTSMVSQAHWESRKPLLVGPPLPFIECMRPPRLISIRIRCYICGIWKRSARYLLFFGCFQQQRIWRSCLW